MYCIVIRHALVKSITFDPEKRLFLTNSLKHHQLPHLSIFDSSCFIFQYCTQKRKDKKKGCIFNIFGGLSSAFISNTTNVQYLFVRIDALRPIQHNVIPFWKF